MKRTSFRKIMLMALSTLSFYFYGFEPTATKELLLAYLENDLELQNLTLEARKAELSLEYSKVSNGFDLKLNSGNIVLTLSEDGTKIKANPSLQLSIPQASGLSLSAETTFSQIAQTGQGSGNDLGSGADGAVLSDTSLSAQLDLVSTNSLSRKLALLKAQRTLTQARRNLQKGALEAENDFYTQLKALLSSIKTLIKAEQSLYSDTIDFEAVKATGYSEKSSTYRLAQMKVLSDKHSVESSLRDLINDYIVFYKKCGYDISLSPSQNYMELIPQDIESVESVNVLDFERDNYSKIEAAVWTNQINSLERKLNSNFSLSAGAGYTFDNSSTNSDSIDTALSAAYGGLSVSAGLAIPVNAAANTSASPALTMAFSLSPSTFKKNFLQTKEAALTEEQELLDIQTAQTDYETYILLAAQELESMLWEKESAKENYEMYSKLAAELEGWYKQGIISESEYMSAKTNAAMYQVEILMNMLDLIIFNDEVQANFVIDGENK